MKKIIAVSAVVLILALVAFFIRDKIFFRPDSWTVTFAKLGTSSSPKAADLNGDGIKDIIIGAGDKEFVKTDRGVIALDGENGNLLWKVPARNQVVGSPMLMDVSGDGVPEVFIGGRSALLFCINGKTGDVIWEYLADNDSLDIYNDTTVLNFYNVQFIPDVSKDNKPEILAAYGGFIKAKPDEHDRPTGYLLVIDPVDGKVLRKAVMPDLRETYLSPVVCDFFGKGELEVIFGSGGETVQGSLYRISLSDVLAEDLSKATRLFESSSKGFIAPPVITDITNDKIPDIIINSVNGHLLAFDGKTNEKLWDASLTSEYEIYTMPCPGYFSGNDDVPDFFTSFGKGVWPEINLAINVLVDGRSGKIVYQDTSGTFQYGSPVAIDLTRDGKPDVIFPVNSKMKSDATSGAFSYLQNEMQVYDLTSLRKSRIGPARLGTNLGSTPLLDDLDNDGMLDIIYCYSHDGTDSFSFKEMKMERIEVDVSAEDLSWSNYMGNDGSALFRVRR
jgi:outer membrane protein assembly factor BamB